jgi:hypothetical protein
VRIVDAAVPVLQHRFHQHLQLLEQHLMPLPAYGCMTTVL